MSRFQQILFGFALGGIVLYTWALYSFGLMLPNLVRVICLFVSIVLILGLLGLTIFAVVKLVGKSKGIGPFIHVPMFLWFALAVGILFVVVAMITNWWIGPAVRSIFGLDALLPKGNLLIAGGRIGWTYVVLAVLVTVGLCIETIKKYIGKSGALLSRLHLHHERRGKSQKVGARRAQPHKRFVHTSQPGAD